MGYRKLLVVLLLSGIPLFAQNPGKEGPVITLERTSCYGSCPVYSVQIFEDGTVLYAGEKFVAARGKRKSKISVDQLQQLTQEFLAIDFFHLKDQYINGENPDGTVFVVTDLPTTYLSLRMGAKEKKVEDYFGAPEELKKLEAEINRVINVHQWLHDKHDLKSLGTVETDLYSGWKPGLTKLMQAAGQGDLEGVKKEIKDGADVNAVDSTGWTALMLAASECKVAVMELLLKSGARADLIDQNGDSALIVLALGFRSDQEEDQVRGLNLLLHAGADVNTKNNQSETPLLWAAHEGHVGAVRALLAAGAAREIPDKNGKIAIQYVRKVVDGEDEPSNIEDYKEILSLLESAPIPR